MNLSYIHKRNRRLYPHKTAVVFKDKRYSFREFDERVNRLIHAMMAKGLVKGDRVAILSHNSHQYLEVYGLAEKGGMVVVPLNFRAVGKELASMINHVEASTLFVEHGYLDTIDSIWSELKGVKNFICIGGQHPHMEDYEEMIQRYPPHDPGVEIDDDDLCYLFYTSGTTGVSRAVMHTHRAMMESIKSSTIEQGITPEGRALHTMPFYHLGGWFGALIHSYRGCTNVVMERFDVEEALRTIERERITYIQLVPTMIAALLDSAAIRDYDHSSLRTIFYASSPIPVSLLKRAIKTFGRVFIQGYGLTESGPQGTVLSKEDHIIDGDDGRIQRLASCGLPCINSEVMVVNEEGKVVAPGEVGEIIIKGDSLMKGYWKDPWLTSEAIRDGWLHTGDIATVDGDGYFYILDRKKDMIISGGENIYPREIEEVLYTYPAVREAAVIGIPDDKWGEVVKAIVVVKEDHWVSEEELVEYCKQHLASYKKPKSIDFVDNLPKSPVGKILKKELRERYWKGQERRV